MVYAYRIVAQRCVGTVDNIHLRSKWASVALALTLAKDSPFTFP